MPQEYILSFSNTLDVILEESDNSWQPLNAANELVEKLHVARQNVINIQHKLLNLKSKVNADLALTIRRIVPSLNVSLDKSGGCKIGYKSKSLTFNPDFEKGIWLINSPDPRFLRKFQRSRQHDLFIGSDIVPLITAIAEYFTEYYKSLNEDINGTGLLLIEGKISTLSDLAKLKNQT